MADLDDLSWRVPTRRARCPTRAGGSGRQPPGRPRHAVPLPCDHGRGAWTPADTVVRRSSHSLTGTGSILPRQPRREVAHLHRGRPSPPDSERGSPTTISTASSSATSGASRSRSTRPAADRLDRGGQEPVGVAAGDADPGVAQIDAEPHAGAHVRQRSARPAIRATSAGDQRQGLVEAGGVGAAALGDVVLAAAAAAEHPAATRTRSLALRPRLAGRVVERGDHADLAVVGRR